MPKLAEIYLADAALGAIHEEHGVDFRDGTHRRNLVTIGVELPAVVGREFRIGGVVLKGNRPCPPCGRLTRLIGADAKRLLHRRGGLRADVVRGGMIRIGDVIRPS